MFYQAFHYGVKDGVKDGVEYGVLMILKYGVEYGVSMVLKHGMEYGVPMILKTWGGIWGVNDFKNIGRNMGCQYKEVFYQLFGFSSKRRL